MVPILMQPVSRYNAVVGVEFGTEKILFKFVSELSALLPCTDYYARRPMYHISRK